MTNSVLRVEGLDKTFRKGFAGSVHALNGVSFRVEPGQITGFLGANGAGKTTTIKCLLELAFADSGEIYFFGEKGLSSNAKARIGFLPERPYFYEYLTGREFLRFYGELSTRLRKIDLREQVESLLKRVGLGHAGDRPLRGYSKGMLQRIGIAQALIHRPELIILDEPMTGLDPDGRHEVREIIRETSRAGTAVFFSSHLLPDAEELCERLVILKKGQLAFEGPTTTLLEKVDPHFTIRYLDSNQMMSLTVQAIDELQDKIDFLRGQNKTVLEVKPGRLKLEEAFLKIAFDHPGEAI